MLHKTCDSLSDLNEFAPQSSFQPVSLTETKDALVLRLKYHKTTLFLSCTPSTTLASLKADLLATLQSTNQPELSSLPQYAQADGKSYPDWSHMDPTKDIGLFVAGNAPNDGGALNGLTIFMPLDQDAAHSDTTVRKAGLKDSDAVCVGFRAQGACKFAGSTIKIISTTRIDHLVSSLSSSIQLPFRNRSFSSPMSKKTKRMTTCQRRSTLIPSHHLFQNSNEINTKFMQFSFRVTAENCLYMIDQRLRTW